MAARSKFARCFGQDILKGEWGGARKANAIPGGAAIPLDRAKSNGGLYGESIDLESIKRDHPETSGVSIFDPVLCELAYRWFCPPGGLILDPFAGGSVRGIVAAKLGRRYVGVDLRAEQIEANRQQAEAISEDAAAEESGDTVRVKVSAKMARLKFNGCDPDYIAAVCHASCCQSSTSPTGTLITVHPSEAAPLIERGAVIEDGLLQPKPGENKCPFKTAAHLCGLHFTPDKPFGCIASPFTLSPTGGTLIVRNRYKMLKCYDDGQKLPAYVAFRASLDLIFGADEAARICEHLAGGGDDLIAEMSREHHAKLLDNDQIKKGQSIHGDKIHGWIEPVWHCADSRNIDRLCADVHADFIFSCPPYADLEVYSDDPADLSTLGYEEFLAAYQDIVIKTCALLKPDRFACFVVGDVRDKAGFYYGFPWHTIAAFEAAGLRLYNEAVLVTAVGSLPIRAGRAFESARKLGKTHQNVLIFCKGDPKMATAAIGPVEFGEIQEAEE